MTALKCPICGAPVPKSKGTKPRKYCSAKCTDKAGRLSYTEREELMRRLEMHERFLSRDEEFAKIAAPVTVEERDGIRIETRGRCCVGWRAPSFFKHG